jgi:hypothetical protein
MQANPQTPIILLKKAFSGVLGILAAVRKRCTPRIKERVLPITLIKKISK